MSQAVVDSTGKLFGDLWHRYDDQLFRESVELFSMRFQANGFDLDWFRGKTCLDAGCGGGRYSIAMGSLGAKHVIGADISDTGLEDARNRAKALPNVEFRAASVLDLPFDDESFDFVCCSGVLHHTSDAKKGLSELVRILRPSGQLFLLLYGKGGCRWPTIMAIRGHAQKIGYELVDRMIQEAELPANKQRTFLDDLFVPLIDFYDWPEVEAMLAVHNIHNAQRWTQGKLDHESSITVQEHELEQLHAVFEKAATASHDDFADHMSEIKAARDHVADVLNKLRSDAEEHAINKISREELESRVFGWGHHRVLATKP